VADYRAIMTCTPGEGPSWHARFSAARRGQRPAGEVLYAALVDAARTVAELEALTSLPDYTIRRSLRTLRGEGLIQQIGGRGRPTTYRRSDERDRGA
jgi:Fic family protein